MKNALKSRIESIYVYSTPIKRYSFISLMLMQYAVYFSSGSMYSLTIFSTQLIGLVLALIVAIFDIFSLRFKGAAPFVWIIFIVYSSLYTFVYISLASGLEFFSLLHIVLNLLILSMVIDSESLIYCLFISICLAVVMIFISNDYIGMVELSKLEYFITIFLGSISFIAQRKIISISNANVKVSIRSITSEISSPISNLVMLSSSLENLSANLNLLTTNKDLKEDLEFLRIISRNISYDSNTAFNHLNCISHIYEKEYKDLSRQSVSKSINSLLLGEMKEFFQNNRLNFKPEEKKDILFYGPKDAVKDMIQSLLIDAFKDRSTTIEISIEGQNLIILQKRSQLNGKELIEIFLPPDKALKFNISGYMCATVMKKLNGYVKCSLIDEDSILFILTFPDVAC